MHRREKLVTRIDEPSKRSSHLSLWLGLLAAISIPSDAELRSQLTEEQYHVTRENGTETLFHNLYWDNNRAGIYVDIVTGEPLFSSLDKYDSGLGLPSFTKPISKEHIVEKIDSSHDMQRIEVRASRSDSHLGHVFNDGQSPTGRRYGVNSAALRFIPLEKLEEEGYGDYLGPFPKPDIQKP